LFVDRCAKDGRSLADPTAAGEIFCKPYPWPAPHAFEAPSKKILASDKNAFTCGTMLNISAQISNIK
jgi:hypothetical protein